ncbi:MAG: DUF3256 family protein [Prevotella sp.]|jgi:hypothetical protein|nr:DUF3256 family protein [Prevotella sp.]
MRKAAFLLLFGLFAAIPLPAQSTIRDVLRTMPDTLVPYLSENNRLDMIDFMASQMDAVVTNALGGKSQMLALTDYYTSVQLSDAALLEMRLLDVSAPVDGASQIVCFVCTYGTDICQSTVRFYSLSWRQLPTADYFVQPDDLFTATLSVQEPVLTLSFETLFDTWLEKENKEINKMSRNLKWDNRFVKEF